jgi:hypothetical protein
MPAAATTSGRRPAGRSDVPGVAAAARTRNLGPMGFNPHRKMAKTPADYAMVIGAVVVCALLLAWAFLG